MKQRPSKSILGGRDVALAALLAAWEGRGFAAEAVGQRRRGGLLDAREASLATQVALTALRHTSTLDHVLGSVATYDARRVSAWVRGALHVAATQIIYLDRVPDFAAVDQAVEQVRGVAGGPAAGMTNAVLRRLTGALVDARTVWAEENPAQVRVSWTDAAQFDRPVLPEVNDADDHTIVATSFPRGLWRSLLERHDSVSLRSIAWASQAEPPIVVHRNPLRLTRREFAEALGGVSEDLGLAADWTFLHSRALSEVRSLLETGVLYVQDLTARRAAEFVGPQPGERILDLCAAPGGKCIALAAATNDQAHITACDVSAARLKRLGENVQALGFVGVTLHALDAEGAPPGEFHAAFDAVLIDVPCSNTGVLARRPEARFRLKDRQLRGLLALQEKILANAAKCVRPGGRLIYSTCSLMPEENEGQVQSFVLGCSTWQVEDERTTVPHWGPSLSDWRDGGYVARLRHR